jgi:hypothetical protein
VPDPPLTSRTWIAELRPDEARMRCTMKRRGRDVLRFSVQLEILDSGCWVPVVRYDNAHGFCHRDTIHRDGGQEKTPVYFGNPGETFTLAIDDIRANWEGQMKRYLSETDE